MQRFSDWLLSAGAHMVLVNRGLQPLEVAQLVLDILQKRSQSIIHLTDIPTPIVDQNGIMVTNYNYFDARTVQAETIIVSSTADVDYVKLKDLIGHNIIFILGYGVPMNIISPIFKRFGPQVIQALYPPTQELRIEVLSALMSEYQLTEYRWIRSREIAASKSVKDAADARAELGIADDAPVGVQISSILLPNPNGTVSKKPVKHYRKAGAVYSPEKLIAYQSNAEFHALERANFVYPPALQAQYNMDGEREVLPDRPQYRGGWITQEILRDLEQYSCKLPLLLARLETGISEIPVRNTISPATVLGAASTIRTLTKKFVICTQFRNHHGLELLASILEIYGISEENGLQFQLHGGIKIDKRPQLIERFNRAPAGVLLMMSELKLDDMNFVGVDEIICFEGTDARVLSKLIDITFKYENYAAPHILQVTLLAAKMTEIQGSVDTKQYKKFLDAQELLDNAFKTALETATGLASVNGHWMVVPRQEQRI